MIGVTAPSIQDDFSTPFTRNSNQTIEMRGVFIHAQMVSQILSAVKDGQQPLWIWSEWGEFVWIWGWGSLGGFLVLVCKRLVYGLGVGIANLVVLSGVCFVVFIQGWWIPLIPSALAFVATGMIVGYQRAVSVSCSVLGN